MIVKDLDALARFLLEEWWDRHERWPHGIVVSSGFYDPMHRGHVAYLTCAARYGSVHVAVVNGDEPLERKRRGGKILIPEWERVEVVDAIRGVTFTLLWQGDTVDDVLRKLHPMFFAKGGDRTGPGNIPEWQTCQEIGTEVITSVGGEKVQSSSWLLNSWNGGN